MLVLSILVSTKLMLMNDFVEKGTEIVKIPQTFQFTEGPVWTKGKTLLFTDIPANRIYQWDGKAITVFREPTQNANGLTIDKAGNLYSCEHGSRSVSVAGKDGKVKIIASAFEGKKLNSPNDVAVHPSGGLILFTDPSYGIRPEQAELDHKSVYMIDLKTEALTQYYKGKNMPNGVLFSPKGDFVYVADSGAGLLEKFTFDRKAAGTALWTVSAPGADGIRVDVTGNIWAACADGVRVYGTDGKLLQTIKFPEQPANLCFGEDGKTLFVTARKGVYYVRVNVKGVMPGF
ncbi:MAG: SMP-30/gluconolactonase/LRE family protein [Armatimonadota bacterium]